MLYGLLVTKYIIVSILLILIVLIQKGKGSAGLGMVSAGTQKIFGGSGGQDILQKTTWVLGGLFMLLSLTLSIMKTNQNKSSRYIRTNSTAPLIPIEKAE